MRRGLKGLRGAGGRHLATGSPGGLRAAGSGLRQLGAAPACTGRSGPRSASGSGVGARGCAHRAGWPQSGVHRDFLSIQCPFVTLRAYYKCIRNANVCSLKKKNISSLWWCGGGTRDQWRVQNMEEEYSLLVRLGYDPCSGVAQPDCAVAAGCHKVSCSFKPQ